MFHPLLHAFDTRFFFIQFYVDTTACGPRSFYFMSWIKMGGQNCRQSSAGYGMVRFFFSFYRGGLMEQFDGMAYIFMAQVRLTLNCFS